MKRAFRSLILLVLILTMLIPSMQFISALFIDTDSASSRFSMMKKEEPEEPEDSEINILTFNITTEKEYRTPEYAFEYCNIDRYVLMIKGDQHSEPVSLSWNVANENFTQMTYNNSGFNGSFNGIEIDDFLFYPNPAENLTLTVIGQCLRDGEYVETCRDVATTLVPDLIVESISYNVEPIGTHPEVGETADGSCCYLSGTLDITFKYLNLSHYRIELKDTWSYFDYDLTTHPEYFSEYLEGDVEISDEYQTKTISIPYYRFDLGESVRATVVGTTPITYWHQFQNEIVTLDCEKVSDTSDVAVAPFVSKTHYESVVASGMVCRLNYSGYFYGVQEISLTDSEGNLLGGTTANVTGLSATYHTTGNVGYNTIAMVSLYKTISPGTIVNLHIDSYVPLRVSDSYGTYIPDCSTYDDDLYVVKTNSRDFQFMWPESGKTVILEPGTLDNTEIDFSRWTWTQEEGLIREG